MHRKGLKWLSPTVLKMHLQENTFFDIDIWLRSHNIAQCPLHHVTYATAKFEGAMCSGLGGDAFTRKYII